MEGRASFGLLDPVPSQSRPSRIRYYAQKFAPSLLYRTLILLILIALLSLLLLPLLNSKPTPNIETWQRKLTDLIQNELMVSAVEINASVRVPVTLPEMMSSTSASILDELCRKLSPEHYLCPVYDGPNAGSVESAYKVSYYELKDAIMMTSCTRYNTSSPEFRRFKNMFEKCVRQWDTPARVYHDCGFRLPLPLLKRQSSNESVKFVMPTFMEQHIFFFTVLHETLHNLYLLIDDRCVLPARAVFALFDTLEE